MTERTRTTYLAIHCSATKPSQDIGEAEIRRWHKQNGWTDIGYNVVIRRNGRVEVGRPLDHRGAHVQSYNDSALGICLIGGIDEAGKSENNFTPDQFTSLERTIEWLDLVYPGTVVQGHRDFPNVNKDCPCFDVDAWVLQAGLRI